MMFCKNDFKVLKFKYINVIIEILFIVVFEIILIDKIRNIVVENYKL